MNAHAEFRRLLAERQAAKREVARVESEIERLVTDEAVRLGLPYDACLQQLLQQILDDDASPNDDSPDAA